LNEETFQLGEDFALKLDEEDPLSHFRERFYLPKMPKTNKDNRNATKKDIIYMDGNSLGLLSKDAEETLLRVLDEWKHLGINGWTRGETPWIWYGERLGALQAQLVGAEPDEVVVAGSTTVNLHTLVATLTRTTSLML